MTLITYYAILKTLDTFDSIGSEYIESEILPHVATSIDGAKQTILKSWMQSVKKAGTEGYFKSDEFTWRPAEKGEKFKCRGFHPKGSLSYDVYEIKATR